MVGQQALACICQCERKNLGVLCHTQYVGTRWVVGFIKTDNTAYPALSWDVDIEFNPQQCPEYKIKFQCLKSFYISKIHFSQV